MLIPGEYAITWNQTGPVGPRGAQGSTGAPGQQGAPGLQGLQGPPGPFPTSLPSGKTLTGVYRTQVLSGVATPDTETFAYPLAAPPAANFVGIGTTAPPQCPGIVSDPQAAPGNPVRIRGAGANGSECDRALRSRDQPAGRQSTGIHR